jgi:hypothetical protein
MMTSSVWPTFHRDDSDCCSVPAIRQNLQSPDSPVSISEGKSYRRRRDFSCVLDDGDPFAPELVSKNPNMGLVDRIRDRVRTAPPARRSGSGLCDIAWEGPSSSAYNEEAFRYFLEIERNRSESQARPFLLLLVDLKKDRRRIDDATATKLFSALWLCVRETDFIGWYRDRRVVGAVLTQRGDVQEAVVSGQVRHRVAATLRESLAPEMAEAVQIRLYRIPSRQKRRSE